MDRYRFVFEHRTPWRVEEMCRVLAVSRSGFYAWKKRRPSMRQQETQRLDQAIERLCQASHRRSGSPKITRALWAEGWQVSENRVAKRMRAMGLRSIVCRRFRVTTQSKHAFPVAPNRLGRCFQVEAPNRVWVNITYIRLQQGWVYWAVFIDLFSRQVVGWALSRYLDHGLVLKALERARQHRKPEQGLMIHSDRGVQYACTGFRQYLPRYGLVQSMSRKADCWDNAVAESFFHLLKTELIHHYNWYGYRDVHAALFEYIELFYNRERMHSTLGYLAPVVFEQQALKMVA
ncbi:MAG: IS3 family transposase [Candidatus Latescibacterota bacterium]